MPYSTEQVRPDSSLNDSITVEDVIGAFAFGDVEEIRDRLALRMRVGAAKSHCDISFGELSQVAATTAGAFATQGCKCGDRIALLMPQSTALIAAFFGARLAGLVPSVVAWPTVKMDREKYERNLRAVLANLRANWVLTEGEMAARLGRSLDQTTILDRTTLSLDRPAVLGTRVPPPGPHDPAFIQFSGGTTGTQKSVPISFACLTAQIDAYARVVELKGDDHFISWLPLYHDMGLVACLVLPFIKRLPVTVFSPIEWVMDPRPFLRAIGSDRATLCWLPNFAFSFLAARSQNVSPPVDLSSLRRVINCSEPVRAESIDRFRDQFAAVGLRPDAVHACYAMAEATFAVTQTTSTAPPRRLPVSIEALGEGRLSPGPGPLKTLVSCGPALPGTHIRIVDANGSDCPSGVLGEIWLRSESVMNDYLDVGELGAGARSAFTDGWFRTGDLGGLVDGHLYITGRKKDVLIVGGVNVYPEDIEASVGDLADIHAGRVVAIGLPDDQSGTEQLVVVAESNEPLDVAAAESLEVEIRKTVLSTSGLAPSRVFVVPPKWIVKSTAGKIARAETRARVVQRWSELCARGNLRGGVDGTP